MSVNGYIAKENNETPWSDEIWKSYYKTAKKFKAIVLGSITYEIMKANDEFNKIGNPFTVVVTSKEFVNNSNFTFVKSPKEALKILNEKGFSNALIVGGGKLNASFMKEKLIDEIYLDIEPLIFGKGVKLFYDENFESKLILLKISKLSKDIIQLHYKIKE